jgi:hypothetical protein
MFDHTKLSGRDSLLLKVLCSLVGAMFGFLLLVLQVVVFTEIMITPAIPGNAVPAPKPLTNSSQCFGIDWDELDIDGRRFTPFDANHDGVIDCDSDIELGA